MGIKDLKLIINKYAKEAKTRKKLSDYNGKKMAVDVSIYLYRFKAKETLDTTFLDQFVRQIVRFKKNGIEPVYIFDGPPSSAKNKVINDRTKKKNDAIEKLVELESKDDVDIDSIEKIKKNVVIITQLDKELCMKLFDLMGVLYFKADGEAEITCARLCKQGLVYGCFSEDTDLLPNGCNYFVTDLCNSDYVIEYDLSRLLKELDMTYEQFVDLCILCGCDYVERNKGIGPINAFKLIKEFNNIEATGLTLTDEYLEKVKIARILFMSDIEKLDIDDQIKKHDLNKLVKFLESETSLDHKTITEVSNMYATPQQHKQTSIHDYFQDLQ